MSGYVLYPVSDKGGLWEIRSLINQARLELGSADVHAYLAQVPECRNSDGTIRMKPGRYFAIYPVDANLPTETPKDAA